MNKYNKYETIIIFIAMGLISLFILPSNFFIIIQILSKNNGVLALYLFI